MMQQRMSSSSRCSMDCNNKNNLNSRNNSLSCSNSTNWKPLNSSMDLRAMCLLVLMLEH